MPVRSERSYVPNLVVAQRVLDRMAAAARRYVADETGEALVGLLVPGTYTNGVPTLYVLDTIAPDESALRQVHTFQQGDERQDELIYWLQENWRVYRQLRRGSYGSALQAKWDVPLRYLGDWHKQPGFMIQPSHGDLMTALNWIDDEENGMDFLLVPIVTLGHPSTTATTGAGVNFVTVPQDDGTSLRVDFWYIDRQLRQFVPLAPSVYPNDQLPGLPSYPWHLVDEARFDTEMALLKQDGLLISMLLWNAIGDPPLEVCFLAARPEWDKLLILITRWDYPRRPPSARVAPLIPIQPDEDIYDLFEQVWTQSEPVADPPDWEWSDRRHLLDYVHAIEDSLGLRAHPGAETSASSAVETGDGDTASEGAP